MKANELNLDHLISIQEKSGKKLKDLQLTFTSTEALGLLRRDLINALGVQRAKRFLLRYGYHCGAHEARVLKEEISWKDHLEWLIAGTKMHHITGRAFSYPDSFQVDIENGRFDVSGYWIDSYEAKQHLNFFSEHSEPVCYYLVGYASGYTSECLGKKTIFKEVTCKGKGDDHCSYVGKTVDAWGNEIAEELMYYEDEDMSGELDQMYRRVEQQKEQFEKGYALSRNLMQAMLEGEGLQSFATIIGESLHCTVLIENRDFEPLVRFGINPGMDQYISAQSISNHEDIFKKNCGVVETDLPHKIFKLLTAPIIIKDQIYGYINIISDQQNLHFLKDLLERSTTITALYIQNERVAIETEQRLKGELLEQLLNNKEVDSIEIQKRFSYLGYNLNEPHYVLLIDITKAGESIKSHDFEYLQIRNKMIDLFYAQSKSFGPHSLILPKLNTLQVIISQENLNKQQITIKEFANQLLKKFEKHACEAFIGVSGVTKDISSFYSKSEEAIKAVELAKTKAKAKSSHSRVMMSNELGYLRLFLNARAPEELEEFAKEKLDTILIYDKKKNSELLITLFYYSQNEFNLHKTAREMSISISGMRYRIQKIEDLLEMDLSSSQSRFEIQICLQILLMLGEIKVEI
ncbi:XylR N-terminal domain-containing protein [Alkalihalobacillus sp. MEB130]|uniref:XylR N-terminal domain-containing protein n=1 Tax=Alkalihalobacillus sp. MEB130 TaxID=2976704 RepID=UPI0028DE2CC3|nr:XylR N-terminal domain-containing protein [Alkalihalobacillus sp. MEB130]MDT8860716.1 XylR N-terminal domain-containing protein [Alkalihalobacillus sp. MEB130]